MAALVDFTALAGLNDFPYSATKALKNGFGVNTGEPTSGTGRDFWRKVRIDFSKTNLAAADWAKFADIAAKTYVFEILTEIIVVESAGSGITIGDANADSSTTWTATQTGQVAGVTAITLVSDANGATRGKYYNTAGALYISGTGALTTLVIDIYIHCMILDSYTENLVGSSLVRVAV